MQKFMTVKEVAIVFRRSQDTIYRWLADGKTFNKVVKVKDGYLIPEEDVKRMIEEGSSMLREDE